MNVVTRSALVATFALVLGCSDSSSSHVGILQRASGCLPGAVDGRACADCGWQQRTCSADATWGPYGACTGTGATSSDTCGDCGWRQRTCSADGTWAYGACAGTGAIDAQACGECGHQQRACGADGTWGAYGACTGGGTDGRTCGNCGWQQRTCGADATWGAYGACTGERECAAGAQEMSSCGTSIGTCVPGSMTRTCSDWCSWDAWGACGGTYVGPTTEICANGVDENCDGILDDGCTALVVSGTIAKLQADPARGVVYALNVGTPSQVIVLDATTLTELKRIVLPQPAHDMDLSPNGEHLVVAHDIVHQISTIDPSSRTVASTIPTASDPYRVEVNDAGVVYYIEEDQWVNVRRIDPAVGFASDVLLGGWPTYEGDLELSPDGTSLYVAQAGSGVTVTRYDVSAGAFTRVDESIGYGLLPYPVRHAYLSPDGARLYFAGHQLDGGNLAFVVGRTGEKVFAEDAAGTVAIGERSVFDARTLRVLATLPNDAAAATFVSPTEFWWYSAATGKIYSAHLADLTAAGTLGSRARPAEPLSSYVLSRLVRDPARPRLYGLDSSRDLVVAIDSDSLTPIGAIQVGSTPTDLALSLTGDVLWVGHVDTLGLARIDRAAFSFEAFLPTPRVPFDVEALSSTRVAVIDEDQWTTPTIIDGTTGAVLSSRSQGAYTGALSATSDGNTLFVGDSWISGGNLVRYDVSAGALTVVTKTTYDNGYGFPYPARSVVALPDGSAVFYASFLLDGTNLAILRYQQLDTIRAVTPDGRIATSATTVYRVADGSVLGTLPSSGPVQAVSPDGATLYVVQPASIATVDLTAY